MARVKTRRGRRKTRHLRVRRKVRGVPERPRLSVHRSLKQIYAQVVDDTLGHTMASASSLDLGNAGKVAPEPKTEVARRVGAEIAKRAGTAGITRVVFDGGGNRYHGRVKALADAAREGGLEF